MFTITIPFYNLIIYGRGVGIGVVKFCASHAFIKAWRQGLDWREFKSKFCSDTATAPSRKFVYENQAN